jgi:hypothetical protein
MPYDNLLAFIKLNKKMETQEALCYLHDLAERREDGLSFNEIFTEENLPFKAIKPSTTTEFFFLADEIREYINEHL